MFNELMTIMYSYLFILLILGRFQESFQIIFELHGPAERRKYRKSYFDLSKQINCAKFYFDKALEGKFYN